ncbi:MAG: hypothetical protein AB1724_18770 [Thermodesulfobacteriota bacterium]
MKQKYLVVKPDKNADVMISEFVELASNEFSMLSEQSYKFSDINKAWKAGTDSLIKVLRSPNFFPPHSTIEKLVGAIDELMKDPSKNSLEVVVDDVRVMNELDVVVDEIDDETDIEDLDEILTDDDQEEEDLAPEDDE